MGARFGMKLLWHGHGPSTQLTSEAWSQIPNDVKTRCERRPKSTIPEHVLGFLKSLKEVKVTLDVKTRNIYELNLLPTHQNRQFSLDKDFP